MHEDELRGVVKSLVDALTYLRKERIIHRNLKPSSVLLDETFRPVCFYLVFDASADPSLETFRLRTSGTLALGSNNS